MEQMNPPKHQVSVIIPVFNDVKRLKTCLDALAGQSISPDQFQAIVVDNGSTDSPQALVESYQFCRFAAEAAPGSYEARNHALKLADGEILAFTDADCIPQPNWLEAGICSIGKNVARCFIGGQVELFPKDSAAPTPIELYDMIFGLKQEISVPRFNYASTANMFTIRSAFDEVGPFDTLFKGGGDADWGRRATALGYTGKYASDVVVRHPARRRWQDILRQARRHAGGRYDLHRKQPYRPHTLHFWISVWKRIFPNIRMLREARRALRDQGYGFALWLQVAGVILAVQYTQTWEFVRKLFGGASERT